VIGGAGEDAAYDVAMNGRGSLAICGITNSTNFPVTSGAYDIAHLDTTDIDAFFILLDSAKYSVAYGTYIGGSFSNGPLFNTTTGVAVDGLLDVYLTGFTTANTLLNNDSSFFLTENGRLPTGMTTVRLPMERIGADALGLALDGLPDDEVTVTRVIGEVVVRESTPPRS